MAKILNPAQTSSGKILEKIFAWLAGIFLALCLLKLGNPVILETKIVPPQDIFEIIYSAWPIHWGYFLLTPIFLLGLAVGRWKKPAPKPVFIFLLTWFGWQFVSATQTVDENLTA